MRRTWAIVATAALALLFASFEPAPQAAEAAPYAQCESLFNTPGLGMECDITVVNNLDLGTGAMSSTMEVRACNGAANTAPSTCSTNTISSTTAVIDSISQCNSSLDGGGASLHCHIRITNNIVGTATAVPATINQCNDSLDFGTSRNCSPDGSSTTNADIAQCNNSDNGGTSSLTCTVVAGSTVSSALPITVSQCNYSANGGGSLVVCSVGITTNLTTLPVPPDEDEVTPPADDEGGTTTPPSSEVLGDQVVAGPFGPDTLASTGSTPASPASALLILAIGVFLLAVARIVRQRGALTG